LFATNVNDFYKVAIQQHYNSFILVSKPLLLPPTISPADTFNIVLPLFSPDMLPPSSPVALSSLHPPLPLPPLLSKFRPNYGALNPSTATFPLNTVMTLRKATFSLN
jgi:hypothetical protein